MLRATWFYVLLAAVVGAGGWYYYVYHQSLVTQISVPTAPGVSDPAASGIQTDEELNKKRQEGIGSIKDLKTVPIEPGAK